METKGQFLLFKDKKEFFEWLKAKKVTRTVTKVQQHHTWLPDYNTYKGNAFDIMEGMRNYHVNTNGWSNIAQHFSVFPDGSICTGRDLNDNPAGIFGQNTGAICIENIGNFDRDVMTKAQAEAIVYLTACLCVKFNISIDDNHIVYHHWFNLSTGARTNGTSGNEKSCPGSKFFGGNKVEDAKRNFYPLVVKKVSEIKGVPAPTPKPATKTGVVYNVAPDSHLNIRSGAGVGFSIVGALTVGTKVTIYEEKSGFYRIGTNKWVKTDYIKIV